MFTTATFVLGVVSCVITFPSPLSLCKDLFHFIPLYLFVSFDSVLFSNLILSFVMVESNLSNLNLGGEISPALGDLRSLQSM